MPLLNPNKTAGISIPKPLSPLSKVGNSGGAPTASGGVGGPAATMQPRLTQGQARQMAIRKAAGGK